MPRLGRFRCPLSLTISDTVDRAVNAAMAAEYASTTEQSSFLSDGYSDAARTGLRT